MFKNLHKIRPNNSVGPSLQSVQDPPVLDWLPISKHDPSFVWFLHPVTFDLYN